MCYESEDTLYIAAQRYLTATGEKSFLLHLSLDARHTSLTWFRLELESEVECFPQLSNSQPCDRTATRTM
ncbi:hypothetical protein CDEST_07418 [Colletotrichum destructivum]|uniref:Uncharacterized protein n=1 Tax=Colletotrichum destructivum TaxID=34406 RepID=A0AAX4IHR2_9PEZI|nr:hypothetical protein CDEST_07418 [Colletotrichum destructivum]